MPPYTYTCTRLPRWLQKSDLTPFPDGNWVETTGTVGRLRTARVVYRGQVITTDFTGQTPWPALKIAIEGSGKRKPDKHGVRRNAVYSRYYLAKGRAASRGMEFTITLDDVFDLGDRQDWKCALSRIRFVYESGEAWSNPYGLSLDRIDAKKGYTPDNVRWVLVAVNAALGQWGDEPLKKIARRIYLADRLARKQ